jgi:membrane-bound lytic murein transglycosylase A
MEEGFMVMMDRVVRSVLLTAVFILACACQPKPKVDFSRELPKGQVALRKISPGEYPDFSKSGWNLDVLSRAVDCSIDYLNHPSSQNGFPYLDISHERAVATLRAFREIVNHARNQGAQAGMYIDQEIRSRFEVYKSVGAPNTDGSGFTDRVLFTGYFTPIYDASLTRSAEYQWPLYKRPSDLATDPVTGETVGRRGPDGKVIPHWTRAEIEGQEKMAGQELVWLKTRWEAYVVTVQGSARLRLPDARIYEVGYAGHNGHSYVSPGKAMIEAGLISKEQLNLRSLGQYFAAHPEMGDQYLWLNPRTVFFTNRPGGPFGALNQPVTSFATIATDKTLDPSVNMTVYPRAMPAFLSVDMPKQKQPEQNWHFMGFMMDQDTGGAIRAAGRCDIYMGIGPEAEPIAGHQLHEGELYYIAIKPELVKQYATPAADGKASQVSLRPPHRFTH